MARALTLTPASATPGAAITVKGTGCLAGETGSVLAPDGITKLGSYTADATGAFTVPVPAPLTGGQIVAKPDALPSFGAVFTPTTATLVLAGVKIAPVGPTDPTYQIDPIYQIDADASLDVKTVTVDCPQGSKIAEGTPDATTGHMTVQVLLKAGVTYPTGDATKGLWLRGWNVPAGNPGHVPNPQNTGFKAVPTVVVPSGPPPPPQPTVVIAHGPTLNADNTVDILVGATGGVVEVQVKETGQPTKAFPVDATTGQAAVHLP